ncbi:MAG TPA: DUF971 domain-containing protein [Methyloceanibacter sp.]|jgi:DUF971 family protein|nr:DUF971 domain-containing protein [Methyloceanibacter sp.]
MAEGEPWPTELKVDKDRVLLTVSFDDGASFSLPAELLRVMSPSAEVQGHSPSERVTVPGKKSVRILRIEPVGNYAARIVFNDGHDTGLYTWAYLRELGENKDRRFQDYLAELAAKRLSR